MPMASNPVSKLYAAQHAPIAPWGVPYESLTEEEKLGPVMFCMLYRDHEE